MSWNFKGPSRCLFRRRRVLHRARPWTSTTTLRIAGKCRRLYRAAKIKVGVGILAHDCILIDISESGVQLHIPGFDVPDEFVLLLSGDGVVRESTYRVVWRRAHDVGAEFVSAVRSGFALQN